MTADNQMNYPTERDDYYRLETFFQAETDSYLLKLGQLEAILHKRKTDYARSLHQRVEFVISVLESTLIRRGKGASTGRHVETGANC